MKTKTKKATLDQYIGVRVSAEEKERILRAAARQAKAQGGGVRATMIVRKWLEDGAAGAAKAQEAP